MNQVLNAGGNRIAQVAQDVVQEIRENREEEELKGCGPAVATRLLTLARPDRLVSVNKQSAKGLVNLAGLNINPNQSNLPNRLANHYVELLGWVYDQPWFKAPPPDDPLERTIWNSRAALLDAFVYEDEKPDV